MSPLKSVIREPWEIVQTTPVFTDAGFGDICICYIGTRKILQQTFTVPHKKSNVQLVAGYKELNGYTLRIAISDRISLLKRHKGIFAFFVHKLRVVVHVFLQSL